MGSFRRRLTALAAVAPTPALADVCGKIRGDWSGEPVTAVSEAIFLFSTLPALALLICTALALRYRSAWGGLVVVVAWTVLISLIVMSDPTGIQAAARQEGCVGPSGLFIVLVTAICGVTAIYTAPRKPRPEEGTD